MLGTNNFATPFKNNITMTKYILNNNCNSNKKLYIVNCTQFYFLLHNLTIHLNCNLVHINGHQHLPDVAIPYNISRENVHNYSHAINHKQYFLLTIK